MSHSGQDKMSSLLLLLLILSLVQRFAFLTLAFKKVLPVFQIPDQIQRRACVPSFAFPHSHVHGILGTRGGVLKGTVARDFCF